MALGLAAACGPKNKLEPAPAANQPGGMEHTARTATDNYSMKAQVDAWPGDVGVLDHVTAVRLTFENTGQAPLRLTYGDLMLRASDGSVYRALSPYRVEGDIEKRHVIGRPIGGPAFSATGYQIAPWYGGAYSSYGYGTWGGPMVYDPMLYDSSSAYWESIELPTDEMLSRALPEGVIDPGGRVDGFVYFEKIDGDPKRAMLQARITDAATERELEQATIPFVVTD